jgi:hypothetical protein
MSRTRICLFLFLLMTLLLSACGDKDDDNTVLPPSRQITLQPQPNATVVPGCETSVLESWFEIVSANLDEFSRVSTDALSKEGPDLAAQINRLSELGFAIAGQPVPEDCALTARGQIMIPVQAILTAYQRFVNGEIGHDALNEIVTSSSTALEQEIVGVLGGVQGRLEEQLQTQAANSTPAQ